MLYVTWTQGVLLLSGIWEPRAVKKPLKGFAIDLFMGSWQINHILYLYVSYGVTAYI